MIEAHVPHEAEIVERVQESPTIFTFRLRFTDPEVHQAFTFEPGQFNMLYLFGGGEVPISIVSDPKERTFYDHTIRSVGRVTTGLAALKAGDRVGIRGPFGCGWPMNAVKGRDVAVITGGLGCAPVVSVINYVLARREDYGRLTIMQGVKHSEDLIWRQQYERWQELPDTRVFLAADVAGPSWPFHVGRLNALLDRADLGVDQTAVMMCGPEGMMRAVAADLVGRGIPEDSIWLSMERNMQCGMGYCGHCQIGGNFVCRNGPVFCYSEIKELFGIPGF